MNRRARRLGARDTRFASPNGLDDSGFSTARDLVAITVEAFGDPTFTEVVATKVHRIPAPDGEPRRVQNRNALLWLYRGAMGVKTGYTAAAGFCLVSAAERDGLSDAAEMLNYGFETWERRTVVDEVTDLDPIEVDGRDVPVRADGALSLLLRRDQEVGLEVRPDPRVTLPLVEGEVVGEVVVTDGGDVLARVQAVAAGTVAAPAVAPEADHEPWWERAWDAVAGFFGRVWRAIFDD
jgi:D-alanyl-D-alanine carboxypeptidase (penicillin-binding protein 5/6)